MKSGSNCNTPTDVVYVGIDVSKDTLAVNASEAFAATIPNKKKDIYKMVRMVRKAVGRDRAIVFVFEDTGRYSLPLLLELDKLGEKAHVANAARVRYFAKAVGVGAKTDPVDADVIRRYAEKIAPDPTPIPSDSLLLLKELFRTRALLVKVNSMIRSLIGATTGKLCGEILRDVVRLIERRIEKLDEEMVRTISSNDEMREMSDALAGIVGVGKTTAAAMLAGVPEIGTLGRRRAASILGLAPFVRQSGKWQGKACTGGGRSDARRCLYMPALSAAKRNPVLKSFYERLVARGKPKNVALAAVMRKLVVHMESVAAATREKHKREKQVSAI
jgi:transposase